jgi:hypothetical protein
MQTHEFRLITLWLLIGWALVGVVIYLSLTASPPEVVDFAFADKFEHLLAYGVLMGWFTQLTPRINRQRWWALGFCLMGIVLEVLQGMSGYRMFDYGDMLANALGVGLGWWLARGWLAGVLLRMDTVLSRLV